ncbi:Glycosyl hydrolases family 32 N-terminal domain-containing protein [Actinopolyspora alba]|uniref:Glycosyl hydrolases family 32 N-terminal domain-containing protein n=1 Tax=Actinopolyspora alba TaxID=673379 RepID=A0A1I1WY74_9ACTN|nr:hypothetical protein [Actinopolyspora alba]SFE00067.1 Glycosyl hydrolases family 32 N-terminal domain-containing protein [Actinopolyspora alba]
MDDAAYRGDRPTSLETHRSDFHFTVPKEWKHDPQRPVFINGTYYYYLYNADYASSGSSTTW